MECADNAKAFVMISHSCISFGSIFLVLLEMEDLRILYDIAYVGIVAEGLRRGGQGRS
ncbi:MAG: hypothetical protein WED04_08260 [Promethearchaeati archaeon SRVP18_Atabeyarchaeia-1]